MANARGRVVFGLLVALLGGALFVVTSAYIVDHGDGTIAAAIAGALAFPVAPALWHLIGERRRRLRLASSKQPPKATLTGFDRFWLRFAVVAIAVIAPMIATSGTGVLGAVKRHGLWFVPSVPRDRAAVLGRVPADAELVLLGHDLREGHERDAVLAWGAHEEMLAVDGTLSADERTQLRAALDQMRARLPSLAPRSFTELEDSGSDYVSATDGWRTKVAAASAGPSQELRDELARAPADARIVLAIAPRTKLGVLDREVDTIRRGVAWLALDDSTATFEAHLETRDVASAAKLTVELYDDLRRKPDDLPERCQDAFVAVAEHVVITPRGTSVMAYAEVPREVVTALLRCARS
jgi:hypothetical protein